MAKAKGKAKPRSKLKPQPQQLLAKRLETPTEQCFRLADQDGWGVAVVASFGWLLMWWAALAEKGFLMGLWLLPGLALLAWATWLVWHPMQEQAQPMDVHRMNLRWQRKAWAGEVAELALPDTLYTSTGALVSVPAHWVGRKVVPSPMGAVEADVCTSERMALRLGPALAIAQEWRWRWMGRWRAQRALAITHGVVALYLLMPLSHWAVNWYHTVASVQPVSAIRSPTLDQLLRQPPEVGEMVHIQAQVRCAERPVPTTANDVMRRLLDCKQRIWSEAGQALTLHLSEPVEPKLEADVIEPLGLGWSSIEVPPQPAHQVGFIGQVTEIERAAGQTVALRIDTRALPSNAGSRRIAVLSTLLAAALALLHGGLGLFASLARRRF